ncbi:MAG TPA: sigma-70 factor domain-containing protein, partial [Dehalococcoidia bacterium]|nr:sigma-70 factor domain-containing protein [Dehalococcoidia bacterium]
MADTMNDPESTGEESLEELTQAQEAELPGSVQMYLTEIGAVPLLKAPEEVELAKKIEVGRLLARYQRELCANSDDLSYTGLARCMLYRVRMLADRFRPIVGAEAGSYA